MARAINYAVRELLAIVSRLKKAYPHKGFTLDGRLVGDIGEILVSKSYQVKLFDKIAHRHDGKSGRRLVQIKATMKESLTFPGNHVPDYYIGIQIHPNGTFRTVYNGPGQVIAARLAHRKKPKNNLHSVSVKILEELDRLIPKSQRIAKRRRVTRGRPSGARARA